MQKGFLVLETGEVFQGVWRGGQARAGEVVFNTSHSGYEEIATDPSYFSQILVLTAPMQGNYGVERACWESRKMWIDGFVSTEMQSSERDRSWREQLAGSGVGILSDLDTRAIAIRLRNDGTPWGALVQADSPAQAKAIAQDLIRQKKTEETDWCHVVSRRETEFHKGTNPGGPRVAILDFGCKENTIRELRATCAEVAVFPSRTNEKILRDWDPDGFLLSNGPGDPSLVQNAVETVRALLGWRPVFGICMGHQILSLALGAKTYKLKFGHRGSNHPVKDYLTQQIYVTSQNHGYAVDEKTLPTNAKITHVNLNDGTVEGIECKEKSCFSVQFHPESHPGPHEARLLFQYFLEQMK